MNIYSGWNIVGSLSFVQMTCLILFFTFLLLIIIAFFALYIYKNILEITNKTIDELAKIAKNPIQNRLKRLEIIALNSKHQKTKDALLIWKVEYNALINNAFNLQQKIILETFQNSKFRRPLFLNWRRINKCWEQTKLISNKLHNIFKQMDKILDSEMIQRNTRIQTRMLFNQLKITINIFCKKEHFDLDRNALRKKIQDLEVAINQIGDKLEKGFFADAWKYQQLTTPEIIKLIHLIDLFYAADFILNNKIPYKINQLSSPENLMKLNDYEKKQLQERIQIFMTHFQKAKIEIWNSLYFLNYDEAFKLLNQINQFITNFEISLAFEDDIKSFLVNNHLEFNNLFEAVILDQQKINKLINYNESLGESLNHLRVKMNEQEKIIVTIKHEWFKLSSIIDRIEKNHGEFNLLDIKYQLERLFKLLKKVYEDFGYISKKLKPETLHQDRLEAKFSEIRMVLSTNEVAIIKNQKVPNMEKYKQQLNLIYDELNKIENETNINGIINKEIFDQLDDIGHAAYQIKTDIKNLVLIEALAQDAIVYLDKFSSLKNFETYLFPIIEAYNINNFERSLTLAVHAIKQYKELTI